MTKVSPASIFTDPREAMANLPMSTAQKIGVLNTLLLTMTDGYDILAMSFAAPSVTAAWSLSRAALGYIMAMNLIGMGLGSVLIAPFADRFGRRRMVLVALSGIAVTMFISAFARTPFELGALRLVTGVCIGGMVGPTLSLATEYANTQSRTLTASIMSVGLPIGGMLGAIAAAVILRDHDWRAIFILGGAVTALVAGVSYFYLPEAVDFLLLRKDAKSRSKLNDILRRYGRDGVAADYVPPAPSIERTSYAGLVARGMRGTTLAMILINFAMMTTIYFLLGWLPQIVADMGFSKSDAASVSIYQNLGGIVGALSLGWAARRKSPVRLTLLAMAGTALTVLLVVWVRADLTTLRAAAAIQGFMALATSAGIYGVLGAAFPARVRSTGIGVAFGFGRVGTIAATIIPGVLFTAGWANVPVAGVMCLGAAIAMAALFAWDRSVRHSQVLPS